MSKSLRIYIAGVVAMGAFALVATTLVFPANEMIAIRVTTQTGSLPTSFEILLGVLFWTTITLIASALPVELPRGTQQAVSIAPLMGSLFLGGPMVGAWVAALGTTEVRELRGRIPWYGTLANHAGLIVPVAVAGVVRELGLMVVSGPVADFALSMVAAAIFIFLNLLLSSWLLALRTG